MLAFPEHRACMIQVGVTFVRAQSRVTMRHVKESFSQEIHTSTASSLAGLVSEISQGQQGFGVRIKPWQPDLG